MISYKRETRYSKSSKAIHRNIYETGVYMRVFRYDDMAGTNITTYPRTPYLLDAGLYLQRVTDPLLVVPAVVNSHTSREIARCSCCRMSDRWTRARKSGRHTRLSLRCRPENGTYGGIYVGSRVNNMASPSVVFHGSHT